MKNVRSKKVLIFLLFLTATILLIGTVVLHKKNGKGMTSRQIFYSMIKQGSYPNAKETLEQYIGLKINQIYPEYISYEETFLRNKGSNQIEIAFYDMDQDGTEECFVADMIPVYDLGAIVLVYKQEAGKIRLIGTVEMGQTHEEFQKLQPPFEQHKNGDSLLYCNKEKRELYTCSYRNELVPKQINRLYRIESGQLQEVSTETLQLANEVENKQNSKFSNIGESLQFYTINQLKRFTK